MHWGDVLGTDGGYWPQKQANKYSQNKRDSEAEPTNIVHITPHRKKKNKPLTKAEKRENDVFSEMRGDIEREFGTVDTKFDMFKSVFRHGEERYNREFKIGE